MDLIHGLSTWVDTLYYTLHYKKSETCAEHILNILLIPHVVM